MKKYLLLFCSILSLSLFSQNLCDVSSDSIEVVFYPNSINNHTTFIANQPSLYLCGNNTIVYDTSMSTAYGCRYVFLNAGTKYYTKNNTCSGYDVIHAKNNSTVVVMPTAASIAIRYEIGATIIDLSSGGVILTNTCSTLIFPTVNCTASGIKAFESENEKLSIYPNPACDLLNVAFPSTSSGYGSATSYKLQIYNSLGQLLKEEEIIFKNQTTTINTKELQNGVYFLKLKNDNSLILSKRIVIAR